MGDFIEYAVVCEHGSLKRKCPHCEVIEQDKRIAELEAELALWDGREAVMCKLNDELREQRDRLASNISVALAEAYLLQAHYEWTGFDNIRVLLQKSLDSLHQNPAEKQNPTGGGE